VGHPPERHAGRGPRRGARGLRFAQPVELGRARGGRGQPARRQHAHRAVPRPLPAADGARRGVPPVGRGRARVRGPAGRVHGGPLRPFASRDPGGAGPGARRRVEHGRPRRDGGPAGAPDLRALPFHRPCALHQFGHGSEPARHRHGRGRDGPAQGDGVRGRLPRRRPVLRGRRQPGERAARLGAGALQRRARHAGAGRAARRRPRLHPGGADGGLWRLHPRRARLPASPARRRRPHRRRPHLRRGDDQPHVGGRPTGAARHHAGHDDARQVHRRRHELRRLRRQALADGAVRPAPRRRPAPRWHLQQQRADHACRRRRAGGGVHGGGGGPAVQPRRGPARPPQRRRARRRRAMVRPGQPHDAALRARPRAPPGRRRSLRPAPARTAVPRHAGARLLSRAPRHGRAQPGGRRGRAGRLRRRLRRLVGRARPRAGRV
ncbi:MAG: Glutamate-1-semialdehyde 2,1-aminomutase, partial [uncultured Acetobacteraceae bacterium]